MKTSIWAEWFKQNGMHYAEERQRMADQPQVGRIEQQADEIKRLKSVIRDYDKSGNLEFACLSLEAMLSQQKEEIDRLKGIIQKIRGMSRLKIIIDACDEALREGE